MTPSSKRQKIRYGIILTTFFLFPAIFYYLSPAIILQASAQGVICGSFLLFCAMFLASLWLGRAYCGWLCPGAGCQEAIFPANDACVTKGDWLKWLIWVPWICTIAFLAVRSGGYHRVDFFYMTTFGLSIADIQGLVIYLIVLMLLIVFPALVLGRRAFCHHLCWMAPFMIVGRTLRNIGRWPSLQLRAAPEMCRHCHTCTENCPMSLAVEESVARGNMENRECILCGRCVDGCRHGVIVFSWERPR